MRRTCCLAIAVVLVVAPAIGYGQVEQASVASAMTVEAQLCTGIEGRMPVGAADRFSAEVGKVYLWCKVTGAADTTKVRHVWFYQGKEMATVELPVKSAAWRTWSYKTILPEWTGQWEVKVLDTEGEVLKAVSFTVSANGLGEPTEAVEPADTAGTKEP